MDETLVSFDVHSLFPNIPLEHPVRVACHKSEHNPTLESCTNLTTDKLVQLLTFCVGTTYLSFQGRVFQQM